jgi:hypothetical protein
VLHTLRCIGSAGLARIAEASGLAETDVQSELIDLAVNGSVIRGSGGFGGWSITESGRAVDAERIADELDAAGGRIAVAEAYDRFVVLNPRLLDLCTAWQTQSVGGVMNLNDHSDPVYDVRVLDRLTDLHGRADAFCADLSSVLLRFGQYRSRLTDALVRANAGELDYVADNMASYHAVWFQLHEDLLVTLGIPRQEP